MYCRELFKHSKRRGAVLAAVLILGTAATGAAFVALEAARTLFDGAAPILAASKRELLAYQVSAMARIWLKGSVESSEEEGNGKFSSLEPVANPIEEISSAALDEIRRSNDWAEISVLLIDQNYSDSFVNEGGRKNIARGKPSVITVNGSGGTKRYIAKRWLLRTSVKSASNGRAFTVTEGFLLLFAQNKGEHKIIRLFVGKE